MTTKRLAFFDFDQTIIQENSDVVVQKLVSAEVIPKYKGNGWTKHMQSIFKVLHEQSVDQSKIEDCIKQIQPNNGFKELIINLVEKYNYDIVIISDANTHFINTWLNQYKLDKYIAKVFSNPAEFQNGLLVIKNFQNQDSCKSCAQNLCKGQVMKDYIETKKENGTNYQIMYIGDGSNDFCPILNLNSSDLACCREGYQCAKLVKEAKEGKMYKNETHDIKSNVLMWTDGFQILEYLESYFNFHS